MWKYLKWSLIGLVALCIAAFLHYTLPGHDIVRVTQTYNRLTPIGSNRMFYAASDVGTADNSETRDVRFIDAVRPSGKVIVYRNEDTGWVWPPYFKYDSSNLQAEASGLVSTAAAPQWAVVTHYGWRIAWLSVYPNAVSIRPVAGPDVRIVPWVNIVILVLLGLALLMLRRMWLQFRERVVDPALVRWGLAVDDVEERAARARRETRTGWGRFRAWLRSLRG